MGTNTSLEKCLLVPTEAEYTHVTFSAIPLLGDDNHAWKYVHNLIKRQTKNIHGTPVHNCKQPKVMRMNKIQLHTTV
jgi:hypothetical protein